ncbi:MAG: hypothetical protein AB7K36_31320, partial [Chloroflexota bacterium]
HAGGLPIVEDPASYARSLKRAQEIRPAALFMGHGFQGPAGDLGPVARGPVVEQVFQESLYAHDILSQAFAGAVQAAPDASGGDLARKALETAGQSLSLDIDPATGFPGGYFRTLPGYLTIARQAASG